MMEGRPTDTSSVFPSVSIALIALPLDDDLQSADRTAIEAFGTDINNGYRSSYDLMTRVILRPANQNL